MGFLRKSITWSALPLEEGERLLAPVRRFGPPSVDQIRPMAYTDLQSMFDAAFPSGRQSYFKAHFLREIHDDVIDILVDSFARVPSPLSMLFFQQTGGAVQRGDTAYAHRDALYPELFINLKNRPDKATLWSR